MVNLFVVMPFRPAAVVICLFLVQTFEAAPICLGLGLQAVVYHFSLLIYLTRPGVTVSRIKHICVMELSSPNLKSKLCVYSRQ